jgi:hypothetical protein
MRKGLREGGLLTMTFLAWPSALAFTELTDLALEKEPNSESGRRECKWVKSLLPLASSTTRKRLVYKLIPSYSERQMNIENQSNCGNAQPDNDSTYCLFASVCDFAEPCRDFFCHRAIG